MQNSWRLIVSASIAGLLLAGCNKPAATGPATGKWGYIDKKGNFIIQPQFDEASDFSKDGAAFVRDGKRILRLKAKPPGESSDPVKPEDSPALTPLPTLRAAQDKGESDTYQIKDGDKIVFDVSKAAATDAVFKGNDYVCVCFGSKYAFIDKSGKLFLSPFKAARDFSEGRAAVQQDGAKWGFINRKGLFVVQPTYLGAGSFVNGLAPVEIPAAPKE